MQKTIRDPVSEIRYRSSGSGRIDQSHPQGGLRGLTKLVKITEDVRKYAGLDEKAAEFIEKGSEVYAKA